MRYSWLLLFVVSCGEVIKIEPDAAVLVDADPCTGTCECRVDADCTDAHNVCVDEVTSRTCQCAFGYTEGVSGGCAWTGVVTDPGFQSASQWTLQAGTAVDANLNEVGMIDPGAARFTGNDGLCKLARVVQDVEMPRLANAEPLVAEITHRFYDPNFDFVSPVFGLGATWTEETTATNGTWQTSRVCLGAGQYAPAASTGRGAVVPLTLMPSYVSYSCADPNVTLDIDHIEIKPADPGECPTPGKVLNGDAESDGGWVLEGSSANGNPFSTMIEAGVGEANTRGVRLFARNRCSNLSATTQLSIPLSDELASPALAFFNRTTSTIVTGVATTVRLGVVNLPSINPSAADQAQRVCIPASMKGSVVTFRAAMDLSGLCADQINATSIIDNVAIINDASCGTDVAITDPGFESSLALVGATATPGRSLARSLKDPAMAHSGNGSLQLSVTQLCSSPSWQANVVVPEATTGAGPALTFFYRAPAQANYAFAVSAGGATFTPVLDNQWNQGTICLDPKLSGRRQNVSFAMSGGAGACATTHPAETAFVDDLSVTTDPACPTE